MNSVLTYALESYFQGEKIEALVFILPIGLLCLVFAVWMLVEGGSFHRGVAIPFVIMGLVMSVVGGVVGYRTPAQVRELQSEFAIRPEMAQQQEIARMQKVNDAWPRYLFIWVIFGVAGLLLRLFFKADFLQGLGIALVFFSGVILMIDGFAERRAKAYAEALRDRNIFSQNH
jgi:hypothetical protein